MLQPQNITEYFIKNYVKSGDTAIDATAGNGNDTLKLAKSVGQDGKVYAFDIQEKAVENTKNLMAENGIENAEIILASHEKMDEYVKAGEMEKAREIQYVANEVIYKMCSAHGNMYAVIKAILKINENLDLGGVRKPLAALIDSDMAIVEEAAAMIREAKAKYL